MRVPILLLFSIFVCHSAVAAELNMSTMYSRLTGKRLTTKNPLYLKLNSFAEVKDFNSAAKLIAEEDADFIDVTAKDFSTRMLTIDGDAYGIFSDMTATVMGALRDDIDAREILKGDFLYAPAGRVSAGLSHSIRDNDLFDKFSTAGFSAKKYIQKFSPQWKINNQNLSAGVFTSRGWAKLYYNAGTNRRSVVGAMNSFLCTPIDEWKKRGLPDFHIRRDIDRAPEGKPSTFQNTCRTCHSAMDGMAGAFARLDFQQETLIFSPEVAAKYNQNPGVYPDGYITTDDSWVNYLNDSQGSGPKEFAEMLSNQEDFPLCMAKRVVKQLCFKDLKMNDSYIGSLAQEFKMSGYKLKQLFIKVALSENCYN